VGSRQELLLAWQVGAERRKNNEYDWQRRDEAALPVSANRFPGIMRERAIRGLPTYKAGGCLPRDQGYGDGHVEIGENDA
jgi:hypothetical protein